MPRFKTAALARHEFLMSRFAAFPLPNSERLELRFTGNLPRAANLQAAINAAMAEAGIAIPEGAVEVSPLQAMQITYLQKLFVKAGPETVPAADDGRYTNVYYSFGFSRKFGVRRGSTIQHVLDSNCQVQESNPVAGIRGNRDEIYELLHVSLRKCADSKITSAAWNAMHVIDDDTRNWLANIVVAALGSQEFDTGEEVVAAVKGAFESDDDYFGNTQRALMHSLFAVFTDNDWYGMLSYCIIWPHEVAAETPAAEPALAADATPVAAPAAA